jgi:hypothetical protein
VVSVGVGSPLTLGLLTTDYGQRTTDQREKECE